MIGSSFIDKLENKKYIFLILLFLASLLFRLPTLFNDYYDVDELAAVVQAHEYLAGDIPGSDFDESKLPLYHALFKLSYGLFPDHGYVLVHVLTILIVYGTAIFLYFAGRRLYGFRAGVLASFLYAVLISSFNRHFMATNGEIVFNLPIAAGLYFLILYLSAVGLRRIAPILLLLAAGVAAALVKGQGLIFLLFFLVFTLIYQPGYQKGWGKKYGWYLLLLFFLGVILFLSDLYVTKLLAPQVIGKVNHVLFYSSAPGFNPLYSLVRYLHRQGMLLLWHWVVWIPGFVFMGRFFRNRMRADTLAESSVAVLCILTYLMIFAGGGRFYFHYFMAVYPALCIAAAAALERPGGKALTRVRGKMALLILLPSLFFLGWNTKDVLIKNYHPEGFYGEGKILYWARAVLVGTFNDYLLPDVSYRDACAYIRNATRPGDRIFVWGDGPYLYYFSQRRMGHTTLWPKTAVIRITRGYEQGDGGSLEKARRIEDDFIEVLRKKKPVLVVDTSENGLSTFRYPMEGAPRINQYVLDNYSFAAEVNRMKIYTLRK